MSTNGRSAYAAQVKTLVEREIDRRWYPDCGHDLLIARSYNGERPAEEIANAIVRDIVQAIGENDDQDATIHSPR